MDDITAKLCLSTNTLRIEYSNEKPNIALSVRTLQLPASSYGDLIPLIPESATSAMDISQTLVYANSRAETEDMQDIIRRHLVLNHPNIPPSCVEFYHRYIGAGRKKIVEDRIRDGTIQIVFATDAFAWVIYYLSIYFVFNIDFCHCIRGLTPAASNVSGYG
jgi:superfamily II DNA helicase RecQ